MKLHPSLSVLLVSLCVCAPALASDPPDSAVNPQSNSIEIADPVWTGTQHDIDYVVNPVFGGGLNVHTVTDHPLDDRHPRLAIDAQGDAWVVWWRDDSIDRVLARKRRYSDGSWSGERVLSLAAESSRAPHVVHDGVQAWVAYELDGDGDRGVAVNSIIDEPDPIPTRSIVATTNHIGPIDVQIHAESGHLWVTWIDGETEVGWSTYDEASATWSMPIFQSYVGSTVDDARDQIRSTVLGP